MTLKKTQTTSPNFKSIFKYFLFAIVTAMIFSVIINLYYINVLHNKATSDYKEDLSRLSTEIETIFEETNHTMAFFTLSEDLYTTITTKSNLKDNNFSIISNALEALKKFKNTRSFYDDAVILRQSDDLALMTQGTSTLKEFFDYRWTSDLYTKQEWLSFTKYNRRFIILKPTLITNKANGQTSEVIPTVQFANADKDFAIPIIVTIKKDHITQLLNQLKLTENSLIFLYDKRGAFVGKSDSSINEVLNRDDLVRFALSTKSPSYVTKLNGSRYLIVRHQSNFLNYVYCAVVPYEDFINESFNTLMLPFLILSTALLFLTFVAYALSKKIYNPIERMISENLKLQEDLIMAIPYVCERYLLSIFNNNEIMNEEKVRSFLQDYDITFPKSHFMVIQSILNFKADFFEHHTKMAYNNICQQSLITASEAFVKEIHSYVFTVSANQICIILNLEKNVLKADLMAEIQKYHKAIDTSPDHMTVHSGIGRIHEGLLGLQKSYHESLDACSQLTFTTNSMIRTYSKADDIIANSNYSIEDENRLVNFLLKGDKDKVFEHFDSIIDRNVTDNIGVHALKELYLQLYNTAIRVLNTKEVSVYDIMGDTYMDISSHMSELKPNQLHDYLKRLYEEVIHYNKEVNTKYDIANLKQYIDDLYDKDIYLDAIAEHFGKSPKYMSTFIKKTLGTTFQDYVASLRINKAKELLLSSTKSVNDIALDVGFNSRHPFIRKFKILEGVTPTEYRKLHK